MIDLLEKPISQIGRRLCRRSICTWGAVAWASCAVVLGGALTAAAEQLASNDGPLDTVLQKIAGQCPAAYPAAITPLPGEDDLAGLGTPALLALLESWNPALRRSAANGLAQQGDDVIPALKRAAAAEQASVRAGAATALAAVVGGQLHQLRNLHPPGKEREQAAAEVRRKYASLTAVFIPLTRDPARDVRAAAMGGLTSLRADTPAARRAMLALWGDPDVHLADAAIISFEKTMSTDGLKEDELIAALKVAMRAPLPRGRGHAMKIINRLGDDAQREFIPELLAHLDWQPDRDTMFGAGGQAEALALLTELRVKEVIPRIPGLITKTMRGPGMFEPCMKSVTAFGKDARVILPQLKAYEHELAESLAKAHPRHIDGINKKLKILREAVQHVEAM